MRSLSLLFASLICMPAASQELNVEFEKYTLDNGLDVVLHEDHSDPIVAVYIYYHVGSGREVPGRSGFAHLFEHMLFQGSEHVEEEAHFRLIQEAGGTLNGSTTSDRTNYYEILPANQLELALWLESDRMGFLLPAITQEKLDNQREVVKNERRQRYENRPYGRAREAIQAALYPPDHSYHWTTIGSMDDLNAASLEDIGAFFKRWYGPNNATLAIGGDFNPAEAKALVAKYFADIPRGSRVDRPKPRPAGLKRTKRIVQEDKVQLPQLTYTWPTAPIFSPDDAALDFLSQILTSNRSAVLDKALTIDTELASMVSGNHWSAERAGTFYIQMRPNPEVTLDQLEQRMLELIEGLGRDGVDPEHLARLKNAYEARTIRGYETVGSRTGALANANVFTDDPAHIMRDLEHHLSVTALDVQRVLERYIIGKPAVILSVVPEGRQDLAASGADIPERSIEAPVPVALDRTQQPSAGVEPAFVAPQIWTSELANGIEVTGTEYTELPLTRISLAVSAGRYHESLDQAGLASMTADLLGEGTRQLDSIQFSQALDALGTRLSIDSREDELVFSMSVLDKHLPAAAALLTQVILEPRFDPEDFARLKRERLVDLETRTDSINAIASDAYNRLLYGETIAGTPSVGTKESITALELADVVDFWKERGTPDSARLMVVGNHDAGRIAALFDGLVSAWKPTGKAQTQASFAEIEFPRQDKARIFLVNKPGAAQSQIRIGHVGIASNDADFYRAIVMNHMLGGSFTSRINLNLREEKGYTYGARSNFSGGVIAGPFTASSGVRTDVTAPAVHEFVKELKGIREGVTTDELAFAKDALSKGMLRQYENMQSLSAMLNNISKHGFPVDYVAQRLNQIDSLTMDDVQKLAQDHVRPDEMVILVVGDRDKVLEDLTGLGLGDVVQIDAQGNRLED